MKKAKLLDFGILILRWYLVFYMINYGWSKLTLSQFMVHDPAILNLPIKDVDSFYVAWHLFGRSTFFNVATGLLEIIGGLLLIFNRTTLIGALLVLSILGQILIIDISFTTGIHGMALPVRIGGMIIADLVILWYYRDTILTVWKRLTINIGPRFTYPWWIFLVLPILGFLTDFVIPLVSWPLKLLFNWFLD